MSRLFRFAGDAEALNFAQPTVLPGEDEIVALGFDGEIGSLEVGRVADVCVWDWAVGPVAERRMEVAVGLHERVFAWMTLGDERNLAKVFVAGEGRYGRE